MQCDLPCGIPTGPQRAIRDDDNVVLLAKFQEFRLGEIWMALNLWDAMKNRAQNQGLGDECNGTEFLEILE